jgi:predicted ArsR family transcriptional regulator
MSQPPIDFNGLDTAVHGPVRLGVLTALHMDGPLDFTTLKKRLTVADGTLGLHLQKLEAVGYLRANTVLHGRRPKTTYRLAAAGRKALGEYMDSMRRLLDAVEAEHRKAGG